MIYVILLVIAALAMVVIQKSFAKAAASDDLSTLSKGQLKQNIAYARMVAKNNGDEAKRAEAAQTIERLQAELDRREAG
ncbi:hypothetical protein [Erythrobacter sp. EC-HK427]|uniref:hypothetical protein n=1 Tax=Erythrobacter sp. EC-HK427 TaxID=2038396 RepID=UPI0012585BF6|nr:hypothetical protein [Erythrobacter sp. EC-HK427]VVT04079.1 hypothetical protein ERY430_41042 [Erythrobacter sp. EC-HK427]